MQIKINYKSFFKKSPPSLKEDYLDALCCGYQGSGKTYFTIFNTETYLKRKKVVYTNIKSYKSLEHEVKYLENYREVFNIEDYDSIFILDECGKLFPKDSRIDKEFYGWLQQSRKHNRHVFLIFQEYIMVPNWIRGVCNKVYSTSKKLGLCITEVGNPVLDKETFEWTYDVIGCFIYKRNINITNLYDSRESV